MRRKKNIPKHYNFSDYKYNDELVSTLINYVMKDGKKILAQKIVYQSLDILQEKTKLDSVKAFHKGLKNVAPKVKLKTKRIGGANYQIPSELNEKKSNIIGIKWILKVVREVKSGNFAINLGNELINIYNNTGKTVNMKINNEKTVKANMVFSHFH